MKRQISHLMYLCFLLLLATTSAAAKADDDDTPFSVGPRIEKEGDSELTATSPAIRYTFVILNTGKDGLTLRVKPQGVERAAATGCGTPDKSSCALSWTLNDKPVDAKSGLAIDLGAGEQALLTVSGQLDELDTYQAWASIYDEKGSGATVAKSVSVKITRTNATLGETPIVPIGGGRFTAFSTHTVPLTLTNNDTHTVSLTALPTARFFKDDGGGAYADAVALAESAGACTGTKAPGLPYLFAPAGQVECDIQVPDLPPGKYRSIIRIAQSGLVTPPANADFSVREPMVYAAACILLGAVVGALVSFWQNRIRGRLELLQRAYEERFAFSSFLATLQDSQPGSREIVLAAMERLRVQIDRLHRQSDAIDDPALVNEATRLGWLRDFAAIEKAYFDAEQPDDAKEAYEEAKRALAADAVSADQIKDKNDDFEKELRKAVDAAKGGAAYNLTRTVVAAPPVREIPTDQQLGARVGRAIASIQFLVSAITVLLTTAIGVAVLWEPSADWGSWPDIIAAILAGAGATATGTIAFGTLVQPYLPRLSQAG